MYRVCTYCCNALLAIHPSQHCTSHTPPVITPSSHWRRKPAALPPSLARLPTHHRQPHQRHRRLMSTADIPSLSCSHAPPPSAPSSRAEKAAALRAKILAKQGQRMALVSGLAQHDAPSQPPPPPTTLTDSAILPPMATSSLPALPASASVASHLTSPSRPHADSTGALSTLSSPPPPPPPHPPSTATIPSSFPFSLASASVSTSSIRPAPSTSVSITSTREASASAWCSSLPPPFLSALPLVSHALSVALGVLFALVPGSFSLPSFLTLLVVLHASPFFPHRPASASQPSQPSSSPDSVDAALVTLLPPSLSLALLSATRAVKAAAVLSAWVDDVCLFVLSAVVARAVVTLTASAAVSSPILSG